MDFRLYLNYIINHHNTNFKKIHNEHKHRSTKKNKSNINKTSKETFDPLDKYTITWYDSLLKLPLNIIKTKLYLGHMKEDKAEAVS